jgi:hypothetical protein
VASPTRLHSELLAFLRQHCPFPDQRQLVLLAWMVSGLLLSQTVCFDRWKTVLPMAHCLAASWQRRCQRWLGNSRIDVGRIYATLILWALQQWKNSSQNLHLALDTSMLWNRYCIVSISIVVHGRAIPLVWRTLVHPSASITAEISIEMLKKADQMLADFGPITLLADRGFPSAELLSWFDDQPRWIYVMRICSDTWINGTAAPMGCEVRNLQLPRGHFRSFQNVRLWVSGNQKANLLLAYPTGIPVDEPWYLISNAHPSLDLVWSYAQRFCCEQLFRDQKSGLFQLESSGLRDPERIDRLLLVVAIAVLVGSLQGYAISFSGLRRQVDPHWQRGMSFVRIGLASLQQFVANAIATLQAWLPIPLHELEPCIPSRGAQRRRNQLWFTRVELPPRLAQAIPSAVS